MKEFCDYTKIEEGDIVEILNENYDLYSVCKYDNFVKNLVKSLNKDCKNKYIIRKVRDNNTMENIIELLKYIELGAEGDIVITKKDDIVSFKEIERKDIKCYICGEKEPTANWLQYQMFHVCTECANKVFPILLADCNYAQLINDLPYKELNNNRRYSLIKHKIEEFEREIISNFRKAISVNLMRDLINYRSEYEAQKEND